MLKLLVAPNIFAQRRLSAGLRLVRLGSEQARQQARTNFPRRHEASTARRVTNGGDEDTQFLLWHERQHRNVVGPVTAVLNQTPTVPATGEELHAKLVDGRMIAEMWRVHRR